MGRVVAPDGTPASGITVTAYEGTSSSGAELAGMTTSSTGTFSLNVGAYGSFFIEAEVACADNPVTDAEIDLCRQEAFSWFDYPGGQMGTVISAEQPVQFGDIQMRSVQPRITGVKRLTHAAIGPTATPVEVPGDYREYVQVTWEYDREDHGTTASDAVTGIALANVEAGLATGTTLVLGRIIDDDDDETTPRVFSSTAVATTDAVGAAHAGGDAGTEVGVSLQSIIQIPTAGPTAYLEFSGEIVLTIAGREYDNPWATANENPSASFNVAAVSTTAGAPVVTSRTATSIGLRWMGTGSPVLQHRVALMIGDRWLLVPDTDVDDPTDTEDGVERIIEGANRGEWQVTVTPTPGTGTTGWATLTETSRHDVSAAQLAGPLQVMILTGQGARDSGTGEVTATGWMSSPAVSVSGS